MTAAVKPGELIVDDGEIELNAGRERIMLRVANAGDRPIQVGSHFHFAETNAALQFDRGLGRGFRFPPGPRCASSRAKNETCI